MLLLDALDEERLLLLDELWLDAELALELDELDALDALELLLLCEDVEDDEDSPSELELEVSACSVLELLLRLWLL